MIAKKKKSASSFTCKVLGPEKIHTFIKRVRGNFNRRAFAKKIKNDLDWKKKKKKSRKINIVLVSGKVAPATIHKDVRLLIVGYVNYNMMMSYGREIIKTRIDVGC